MAEKHTFHGFDREYKEQRRYNGRTSKDKDKKRKTPVSEKKGQSEKIRAQIPDRVFYRDNSRPCSRR